MSKQQMYIGVDLGGTFIKNAFVNENGEILAKWEINTDLSDSGNHIVKHIVTSIQQKCAELGLHPSQFVGIGVGAPGPVNTTDGSIIEAVNLGWENFPLKKAFELEFSLPTYIENDANAAAYGELWQGAGVGENDLVAVTLGTGVGAGIICNGQVVSGIRGAGGEIGHMSILLENGYPCNCGNSGCLETLVSAPAIARLGYEVRDQFPASQLHLSDQLTSEIVFRFAEQHDEAATIVVDRVAYYLGVGLANIGNILNPALILLGGGVAKAREQLLAPTLKYFQQFTFAAVRDSTRIQLAKLGNDAGVIGAAYLVKLGQV